MERRSFSRQILNYQAEFSNAHQTPQKCLIEDFCRNGLLITFDYQNGELLGSSHQPFRPGDNIVVSFSGPGSVGMSYKLHAQVARVLEGAMGLVVTQNNPEAIHTLYSLAEKLKTTGQGQSQRSDESERILHHCASTINNFINATLKPLFKDIEYKLVLEASRSAKNNAEETAFFDTIAKLKKYENKINGSFRAYIAKQVDNWITGEDVSLPVQSSGSSATLSLVGKEDFEDWMVIKVLITRTDQRYRDALFDLQMRFSEASNQIVNEKNNPISPSFICHGFYHALQPLALSRDISKQVFDVFEEVVVDRLQALYDGLNEGLAKAGILPDIDQQKAKGASSSATIKPVKQESSELLEANKPTPLTDNINQQGTTSAPPVPGSTTDSASHHTPQYQDIGQQATTSEAVNEQQQPVAEIRPTDTPTDIRGSYAQLHAQQLEARQALDASRKLMSLHRQVAQQKVPPAFESSAVEYYEVVDVADALQSLQLQAGHANTLSADQSLRVRVQTALGDDTKQLSQADEQAIDLTDNLVSSMINNKALHESTRSSIKHLEVPLLKVLQQDDRFFEDEQHPARQVFNRLGVLSTTGGLQNEAVKRNVDHLIQHIIDKFEQDPKVFSEVLDDLDGLLDKQRASVQKNIERVVASCEGTATISDARKNVAELIRATLEGKLVPQALSSLVKKVWRDLLVFTLLRDGRESSIWNSYVRVLEQLSTYSPDPSCNEALLSQGTGLMKLIEAGMKDAPSVTAPPKQLLAALRNLLVPGPETTPPSFIEYVSEPLDETDESALDATLLQDKAMVRWIKRAKRLSVGQWIEYAQDDLSVPMRLAWVGQDHSKFVFVNHQGVKVIEFGLAAMAENMQKSSIRIIDNADAPLVDQALDQMVQELYEQLNFQVTHDEVTGLINRKEFERQLGQALNAAKTQQIEYAFYHLDLDQFMVVNTSCGRDAGNLFLKQLTQQIQSALPERACLARFDGEEFGVLIDHCDAETSLIIGKHILDAVQQYRFAWDEKTYTAGVSIGLVILDEAFSNLSSAIKAADSALLSAKEGGKNRVHLYESNDEDQAERTAVMDKVASLNKALDEERLQLRCQKIAPIDPRSQDLPHYEILLSVEDENGVQLAPGEFIQAAERYNRMQAVDRWVIRHVLQWVAMNASRMHQIGGCTINLSGHSLNDESLLGYIFEELVSLDIPRHKVCFEVTETAAIASLEDAVDFISEMKNLGFKFALDDFGAGLSSYKYLKTLPVDYIKIDGTFIKDIATNPDDLAMVRSINEMAHMMGKHTIAEYVESDEILHLLQEIGVDFAQGYGIEMPRLLDQIFSKAA